MSFYIINKTNNTLVYNINQSYTIPVGNYNALELADHLNSNIAVFTNVSYNSKSNEFSFFSGSSFKIESTSTCLQLLGYSGWYTTLEQQQKY